MNFPLISNAVINVDEFLAAITSGADGQARVQPGDTVYGSDHGEIGQVEEVGEATRETDGYLLVASGLIFKTDTYIPLDTVVKRSGTDVFINLPKMVVGDMPWSKPPTQSDNQAKQGPAAAGVDKLYGSYAPPGQPLPPEHNLKSSYGPDLINVGSGP